MISALLTATLLCLLVQALPIQKPKVIVFGDSLSDTGRFKSLTHGLVPPPYYWQGRFSSGPVWSEWLALLLDYDLSNNAVGLAKSTGTRRMFMHVVPLDPPTTNDQIAEFALTNTAAIQPLDIAVLEVGSNDAASAFVDIESGKQSAYEFVAQQSDIIIEQLEMLRSLGFSRILVTNLPSLQHTPEVIRKNRVRLAETTVAVYNRMLMEKAQKWSMSAQLDLFGIVDLGSFLELAISDQVSGALGITDTKSFCAGGRWLGLFEDHISFNDFFEYAVFESGDLRAQGCDDPASKFFFDPIHPTERVHRLFGYYAHQFLESLATNKHSNATDGLLTRDGLVSLITKHNLSAPAPKPASI
ncbi:hypothetical protein GGI25_003292 [Coemansia spiralis]|uniref:Uncharacterized protein n=2 Tax=Coemansia TaxID=4863 RepID=A0A9W8G7B4_9FUNG|nr:hypothetical protein BX070DRAFT_222185 [Coemansia spiralis]KAJ1992820.1 hypothetical protein EDC05_002604 [Coemansia umbellata]KAJ2622523.1 hypothetical protein GGI26_003122 [Coemansia sp. RSA 1358]KAJ2677072.1 hypothetical protein GGI25_003292 [Coemansia spiralis]